MDKQTGKQLLEQTGRDGVAQSEAKPQQNASSPSSSPFGVNSPPIPTSSTSPRDGRDDVDGKTIDHVRPDLEAITVRSARAKARAARRCTPRAEVRIDSRDLDVLVAALRAAWDRIAELEAQQ